MLYLNCTTFTESSDTSGGMSMKLLKRMDMGISGSTSDECRQADRPYLETLANCIRIHCDAEGLSHEKQNSWFQKMAAGGQPVPSLIDSLPTTPPAGELAEDAEWLNETMLVNEAYWTSDRGTIEAFETSEDRHVRFSWVDSVNRTWSLTDLHNLESLF